MPEATFEDLKALGIGDEITNGDTTLTITEISEAHSVTDYELTYDNGVTQDIEELHAAINKHGSVWIAED